MKTKHILAATAIAAACHTLGASAEVFNGATYGAHQYGAWTGLLVTHGDDTRFRASTSSGNWNLIFDAVPPSCDFLVSLVLWIGGDTIKQDIPPADYLASLRVDQNEILQARFNVGASMGDQALLFTGYVGPIFNSLLTEMQNGQQLMLKLSSPDGQSYYATFPLNGFTPAILAETRACVISRDDKQPAHPAPQPSRKKQALPDNTKIL